MEKISIVQKYSIHPIIEEIYKTKLMDVSNGKRISPFPSALSYDRGIILYFLIKKFGLKNCLEVGLGYGLSAMFICNALLETKNGKHTAIDAFQKQHFDNIGIDYITKIGAEKIFSFYNDYSYNILPKLLNKKIKYNLVFIDGMHLFDYALVDFFLVDKLLNLNGFLVFDDIWMPSINKVVNFIINNYNYKVINLNNVEAISFSKRVFYFFQELVWDPYQLKKIHFLKGSVFLPHVHLIKSFIKWKSSSLVILQKIKSDERNWYHYKNF